MGECCQLDFLAKSFPSEFARDVPEIRGQGDSTLVPMAGPIAPVIETTAASSPDAETPADNQPTDGPGVWQ